MNALQDKLLKLMVKFDSLCRENGIVYYLGGGSALGAVRHHGFLPWDDDVDLYMTRENYQKLLESKDGFFSDDFILVNHHEYPSYGNTLVRCVDPSDCSITKARIADGTPKGSFVEIFILDPMPVDEKERDVWLRKHYVYTELMSLCFRVSNRRVDPWVDPDLYHEYYLRYLEEGRDCILAELEADLFCLPEKEAREYCSRWGMRNLIYDIEWFGKPRYIPFEDKTLPVPRDAERVLRFDYGDTWMMIPEHDLQIVHTFAESTRISYSHFVDDYIRFINIDKLKKCYAPRKVASLDWYFSYRKNHKKRQRLKEAAVSASLAYRGVTLDKVKAFYENSDFEALESEFSLWEKEQLSTAFWGWEKAVSIDREMLFYALIPLLMKGEYSKVRKVLLWSKKESDLPEDCSSMLAAVECIRDAYIALEHGDEANGRGSLEQAAALGLAYIAQQYDYRYLSIAFSLRQAEPPIEWIEEKIGLLLAEYPDKGDVLALHADLLSLLGRSEEALAEYARAKAKTNNGLVLLHVSEQENAGGGEC